MEALARYPHARTWFNLGDRDLATHLYRTDRLRAGATLSTVSQEIAEAWQLGLRLLPVTDDRLQTRVTVAGEGEIGFQEYFVERRHDVAVTAVRFDGAEQARPAPDVLEAVQRARRVVVAPSNPLVSIDPVLAVPGVRAAVESRRADVVAVSPIIAGAALKGPADRLLRELGHDASVVGVARLYAPLVGTLVIDDVDAEHAGAALRGRPDDHARSRGGHRPGGGGAAMTGIEIVPVEGIPEVRAGDDLAGLIAASAPDLRDGDVVVVTQKVVSKAEGAMAEIDPSDPRGHKAIVEDQSVRIVRRRGDLLISETKHGFVCANAGVDLSNVDEGWAALLPDDSDRSARRIRDGLRATVGVEVAVIVSDTFGRPWRRGLTDVAIGCAGIRAVVDLRGTEDSRGRELQVTEVCVVDELAAAAELVMGKATGVAAAVVRGVEPSWLGRGEVQTEVVRPPQEDLFR
jgi:coenzyme F420-0:L-glutamate ligase